MASRKNLKKNIKGAIDFLFVISVMIDQKNDDKMYDIINKMTDLVVRISHTEPGKAKEYYKNLRKEYNDCLEEVNGLIKEAA